MVKRPLDFYQILMLKRPLLLWYPFHSATINHALSFYFIKLWMSEYLSVILKEIALA